MIVVDTNIIVYLFLPVAKFSEQAEQLLATEPEWIAPILWRSEFRNTLTLYMRKKLISCEEACFIQAEAELLMQEHEYEPTSDSVLRLASTHNCSAYDCEFIALAQMKHCQLRTMDKKIVKLFPEIASPL